MRIERYTGRDSRSAMAQARAELGDDAMILANRRVGGQVEITAAVDIDGAVANSAAVSADPSTTRTRPRGGNELQLKALERELQRLQSVLEQELGDRRWQDSAGLRAPLATLRQRLLTLGLSRRLTASLLEQVPAQARLEQGWRLALAELAARIDFAPRTPAAPGITALYGGTGVGKSSTIARLAARDLEILGGDRLGLISLDSYRIGAREQLASFARAVGVTVCDAHDGGSLAKALRRLRGRRIYIDTAGMSQRDSRLRGQYELVSTVDQPVEHLLVMAASAQASQCRALAAVFAPGELSGAIISKVDEAQTLGGILDVLIGAELALVGFSDGQRVPEDLHSPDPRELVRRATALTRVEPAAQDNAARVALG